MSLKKRVQKFITEAARWKDEGWEKQEPIDVVRSYVGEKDVLLHFTDVGSGKRSQYGHDFSVDKVGRGPKLGIVPSSRFVPFGVYGYILDRKNLRRIENDAEFATGRAKLYIFKADRNKGDIIKATRNDDGSYSSLMRDLKYLGDKYHDAFPIEFWFDFVDDFDELMEEVEASRRKHTDFAILYEVVTGLAENLRGKYNVQVNKLLRELGIGAIFDWDADLIHHGEAPQGVVLNPKAIEVLEVIDNPFNKQADKEKGRRMAHAYQQMKDGGMDVLRKEKPHTAKVLEKISEKSGIELSLSGLLKRYYYYGEGYREAIDHVEDIFDVPKKVRLEDSRAILTGGRYSGLSLPIDDGTEMLTLLTRCMVSNSTLDFTQGLGNVRLKNSGVSSSRVIIEDSEVPPDFPEAGKIALLQEAARNKRAVGAVEFVADSTVVVKSTGAELEVDRVDLRRDGIEETLKGIFSDGWENLQKLTSKDPRDFGRDEFEALLGTRESSSVSQILDNISDYGGEKIMTGGVIDLNELTGDELSRLEDVFDRAEFNSSTIRGSVKRGFPFHKSKFYSCDIYPSEDILEKTLDYVWEFDELVEEIRQADDPGKAFEQVMNGKRGPEAKEEFEKRFKSALGGSMGMAMCKFSWSTFHLDTSIADGEVTAVLNFEQDL